LAKATASDKNKIFEMNNKTINDKRKFEKNIQREILRKLSKNHGCENLTE